jgi:hypothetical protein
MPQPPSTTAATDPKDGFDPKRARRLLGMYVLGVAIGCVLVGMMLNLKKFFRPPAPAGGQQVPAVQPAPAQPSPETGGK